MTSAQQRPSIPKGVGFTLIALSVFGVLGLLMGDIYGTVITVIFLRYLHRGHPLARQWACMSGLVLFLTGLGSLGVFSEGGPSVPADTNPVLSWIWVCSWVGLPVAIWIGLSVKSSRRFFDLQCPHCQSYRTKALNFLYSRIECKECKRGWEFREPRVDPQVSD
jgi:hypothetical protein